MNFKNICAIAALIFIILDTTCAAKKKEIFIPGPSQEVMARIIKNNISDPEFAKAVLEHYIDDAVASKLIELYAKEHPLPNLKKYEQQLMKAVKESAKDCESRTADEIRGIIAYERISKRLEILSAKELQDYYKKIQENPSVYPKSTEAFNQGFPPFSEELRKAIHWILADTWMNEEELLLKQESIENLKRHPVYIGWLKECKESRANIIIRPLEWAFDEFIFKKAQQNVQAMSNGQVKKYYEEHPLVEEFSGRKIDLEPFSMDNIATIRRGIPYRMVKDLTQKTLRPIAQKYTFKSDNPEVLAYIEKFKSGKDQS